MCPPRNGNKETKFQKLRELRFAKQIEATAEEVILGADRKAVRLEP